MKKSIVIYFLLLLATINLNAQNNFNGDKLGCVKYEYILAEKNKSNKPLFSRNKNKNPFSILINAIRYKGFLVYSAKNRLGEEFSHYISEKDIYKLLKSKPLNKKGFFSIRRLKLKQVNAYFIIQGLYYDKNNNLISKRPIGFAPAFISKNDTLKYFWVYFPDFYKIAKNIHVKTKKCKCSLSDYFFNSQYQGKILNQYYVNFNEYDVPYINKSPSSPYKNNIPTISRSEIKFAKLKYYRLDINDTLNKPLFYPKKPLFGYQNLINIIYVAERENKINIYSISPEKLGTGNEFLNLMNENAFIKKLDIKDKTYPSFDKIKQFVFIFIELYDYNNKLYKRFPLGIIPVKEGENNRYYLTAAIYYPQIQPILAKHYISTENCNSPQTFAQFIEKMKFNALAFDDTAYIKQYQLPKDLLTEFSKTYIDINNFLRMLPTPKPFIYSQYPTPKYHYPKITGFQRAEIVYTKIPKTQYPELFLPQQPERGYINLTQLLLNKIRFFGYIAYKSDKLEKIITEDQILKKLGCYDTLNLPNNDTILLYNRQDIKAIKTKELWLYDADGNIMQKRVIALTPVIEYTDQNGKILRTKELFWIKVSDFMDVFSKTNITKLSNSRDENYAEFFIRHLYKPEILKKEKISKKQALKIINNE